ncbi:MAG: hypothetical protein V1845_01125 [bacterium]
MNYKASTIFFIITTLILAGILGYFIFHKTPAAPPIQNQPSNNLQTYKNGTDNFQFQYPAEFYFVEPTGYSFLENPLVQIQADATNFPGTNLGDYAFSVSNQYNFPDCLKSENDKVALTETQVINGVTFYKDTTTGAAAGNLYDSQVYRTVRNNWCYELNLTVHTGNIGNYPEGTVKEVDKNKVFDALNQILVTFKFF